MATGDVDDLISRIRANLPPWFPNQGQAPVLDAILAGIATLLANVYALISFAGLQTRIKSASGAFLDLIAWDYFGGRFTRLPGESDQAFLARLLPELIRARVTREAIQAALEAVTGYPVRIIEPAVMTDNGFYKMRGSGVAPVSFYRVDTLQNPARYAGRGLRCQFFVECTLPLVQQFGNNAMPAYGVRGGSGASVWSANWMLRGTSGARKWGSSWLLRGASAAVGGEELIYSLINAMRAAGVIAWVRFVPVATSSVWDQPNVTWDSGRKWDQ
jgi:hypothetical protein